MTSRVPAGRAPRPRWAEALLVAGLLGVVIATRALDANAIVTWDEPAWTYRSAHFLLALARGDLGGTALTGHPGVTTTWLGALGLAWNVWVARTVDWAQLAAVGALPSLEVHDAATMRLLAALLPAAKSALPLAHAAIALAAYALLRRLAGWGLAVAALLVLAFDPYYLAMSRVLHIDALTAGLMLVSVLAAMLYRGVGWTADAASRRGAEGRSLEPGRGLGRRRYLVLSAVAAGLAVLTKTYGGFVTPVALALLVGGALRGGAPPLVTAEERDDASQGSSLRSERRWAEDGERPGESPNVALPPHAVVPNEVRDLDARKQATPGAPPPVTAEERDDASQGSSLRSERRWAEEGERHGESPNAAVSPHAVVPNEVRDLDTREQAPPGAPPAAGGRDDVSQGSSLRSERREGVEEGGRPGESPNAAFPPHAVVPNAVRDLDAREQAPPGVPPATAGERDDASQGSSLRSERREASARARLLRLGRDVALWGGLAAATFVLAWPAMWVAPARTLGSVLGMSLEYATAPGDATASFFRGALTADPGVAFYPVALLYRATPLVLAGAVLAVIDAAIGSATRRRSGAASPALTWGLLAYAAVHLALITLSAKKFDRYLLPALLALDVVAAVGWLRVLQAVARHVPRRRSEQSERPRPPESRSLTAFGTPATGAPVAGVAVLAVVQAALLLAPFSLRHAIACYNPLVGGLGGAARALPVGWGEGIESVARYLAALPDAGRLRVATWAVAGVAPHFPGQVDKPTDVTLPNADYVVVYVGDVQGRTPLAASFAGREPAFVARVGGEPYAWVYRNDFGEALAREIRAMASPGDASPADAIVLNAPSAFERQYEGAMRWDVVTGDEGDVARGLAELIQDAGDVVYVAYDGQPSHAHIRRLLARNGLLLDERPFADAGCSATLYRYRLLPESSALRLASPSTPMDAVFGGELALEGYGVSSGAIEYRQELGVALRWRALAPPAHDYHVSVRLLDADGRTWGQYDAPLEDEAGDRASAWAEGSAHHVDLPLNCEPGTPPGAYRLVLSLYRLEDLRLLEIVAGEGPATQQLDLGPVRVRPARVPPRVEDLAIPHPAELSLGGVQVIGYALSRDVVPSGEEVAVTLYWRCLEPPGADLDLLLRVLDADGREVGRTRARPVGDGHPTDRWRAGEVLRDAHTVRVDPRASDGRHDLVASLVPHGDDAPDGASAAVVLMSLTVEHVERLFEAPAIAYPQAARFGAGVNIALLGYDLAEAEVAPGGALHLTLYWCAGGPIDRSYTAFVHLLDEGGAMRGQRDSVPASGARPTDGWSEGEVIVDPYVVDVAADAPAGPHRIAIGLYDPTTGERLPVTGADGRPIPEGRLILNRTVAVHP